MTRDPVEPPNSPPRIDKYEFDQYQRYFALRSLADALVEHVRPSAPGPYSVLDLGCGPASASSVFLGSDYVVTHADISSFGQPGILVVPPAGPLPFADLSFDIAIAIEVLEHLSIGDRPRLIAECGRIAKVGMILSCPRGAPDVEMAEEGARRVFEFFNTQPHPFLSEHCTNGLPTEDEVRDLINASGFSCTVVPNSRLDQWQGALMVDQVLRTMPHNDKLIELINASANRVAEAVSPIPSYRNMYVASRTEEALADLVTPMHHLADLYDPTFQAARICASALVERERQSEEAHAGEMTTLVHENDVLRRALETIAGQLLRAVSSERADVAPASTLEMMDLFGRTIDSFIAICYSLPHRPRLQIRRRAAGDNVPFRIVDRQLADVLVGSEHALWMFRGEASLITILGDGLEGTLSIRGELFSPDATTVRVCSGDAEYQERLPAGVHAFAFHARVAGAPLRVSCVSPSGAALGDFHIVRERPFSERLRVRVRAALASSSAARRLANTQVGRAIRRRLGGIPSATVVHDDVYAKWIIERVGERRSVPRIADPESYSVSLLTSAWNTPSAYLAALADSVMAQDDLRSVEWIILDNGSTNPETLEALERISKLPIVRAYRVDQNLGIVGGMRFCLEHAANRYFVPLDSDDYLYSDCIRLVRAELQRSSAPQLLYSDEDKLAGSRFTDPYLKPDWDPVLFLNSCYIAHLCCIDREASLNLGVYSDPDAEGCHDWDTFMRFYLAGHEPVHLAEVVYSWRMHPGSTTLDIDSKPYVAKSHQHVLEKFLENRGLLGDFSVQRSPLFKATPDWHFVRRATLPGDSPMPTILLNMDRRSREKTTQPIAASNADLRGLLESQFSSADHVELRANITLGRHSSGAVEAAGLFSLHPDAAIIGGLMTDPKSNRVVGGPEYFGFGGILGCPDVGRNVSDPGYFAQLWKQRSVSAITPLHFFADRLFLLESLEVAGNSPLALLGAWLGLVAAEEGRRVVYTPFIRMEVETEIARAALTAESHHWLEFRDQARRWIPEPRFLSPLISLSPRSPFGLSSELERSALVGRDIQ